MLVVRSALALVAGRERCTGYEKCMAFASLLVNLFVSLLLYMDYM